jgi:hypothetical protein
MQQSLSLSKKTVRIFYKGIPAGLDHYSRLTIAAPITQGAAKKKKGHRNPVTFHKVLTLF